MTSAVAAPKTGNSGGSGDSGGANEKERGEEVFGWSKGGKRVDKVKRAKVHGPLLSGVQHAFARSYIVISTSAAARTPSETRAADHEVEESAASYSRRGRANSAYVRTELVGSPLCHSCTHGDGVDDAN